MTWVDFEYDGGVCCIRGGQIWLAQRQAAIAALGDQTARGGIMSTKVDSREVGLIAGLNLFNFFIGTRDLHYGLWQDDLEVSVQNLPEAQRRYSEFLIGHIPSECQAHPRCRLRRGRARQRIARARIRG